MPIAFACPKCGQRYNVADHLAGKRVRCSKCGDVASIPASSSSDYEILDDDSAATAPPLPTAPPLAPPPLPGPPLLPPMVRAAPPYYRPQAIAAPAPSNATLFLRRFGLLIGTVLVVLPMLLFSAISRGMAIGSASLCIVGGIVVFLCFFLVLLWKIDFGDAWLLCWIIPFLFLYYLVVGIGNNWSELRKPCLRALSGVGIILMGLLCLQVGGVSMADLPGGGGSVSTSAMPDLPAPIPVGDGISLYTIKIKEPGWSAPPLRTFQIYLPAGEHRPQSLPCIFIAPAGSNLLFGMGLGPDDSAEHLPYAKAGFAVVAYSLDGDIGDPEHTSETQLISGIKAFMKAGGGLANGRAAIDYALAKVPQIDSERLYAAGHSSAANVALLLAAREPRIRGCIAYAPCTDGESRLDGIGALRPLERVVSGTRAFIRGVSPINFVNEIRCPVFLFHAEDDSNVSVGESRMLRDRLPSKITLVTVPTGDHYDSMISQGIPRGIAWLKQTFPTKVAAADPVTPPLPQPVPVPRPFNVPEPIAIRPAEAPAPVEVPQPVEVTRPAPEQPPTPQPVIPAPQPVTPKPQSPVNPPPVNPPRPDGAQSIAPRVEIPALPPDQQALLAIQRLGGKVFTRDGIVEIVDLSDAPDRDPLFTHLSAIAKINRLRLSAAQLTAANVARLRNTAIVRLDLSGLGLTDERIKPLAQLTNIEELDLSSNEMTDAGLASLKGMTGLRRLMLRHNKLLDAGLANLKGMSGLRFLDLSENHITGAGLVHLKGLTSLIGLNLGTTDVREEAVEDLKRSLTSTNIIFR